MRYILLLIAVISIAAQTNAQEFEDYFTDNTLRLDYIFGGNNRSQYIFFHEARQTPGWHGRKSRLSEQILNGNGQLTVRDTLTNAVIYCTSFSTLFQEWQTEEEATKLSKSFENSYVIPYPKRPIEVTITLRDTHARVTSELCHVVDPSDILIRKVEKNRYDYSYVLKSGESNSCVDIAIIPEGYTSSEKEKFLKDCQRTVDALFSHEPFSGMKSRFNVLAVDCPSRESGPTIPRRQEWKDLPCGSHYDTFYTDRYLMTSKMWNVYDILDGIPFDQIIILVNTDLYGGGGIYNQINVFPADHPTFKPLLVHEFGHGYGGLADEYYYDDQFEAKYPSDTEPWEPNITTMVDFKSKWKDMLPSSTAIPTPFTPLSYRELLDKNLPKAYTQKIGVYEGGGYQSKGVYRPCQECRMKVLEVEDFCPVCTRALKEVTEFYTSK